MIFEAQTYKFNLGNYGKAQYHTSAVAGSITTPDTQIRVIADNDFATTKRLQSGHEMVHSGCQPPCDHFGHKEVTTTAQKAFLLPKWSQRSASIALVTRRSRVTVGSLV